MNWFVNIFYSLCLSSSVSKQLRFCSRTCSLFVTTEAALFHSATSTSLLCSRKRTYAQRTEDTTNNRIIIAATSPRNAVRPPRMRTLEFPNEKPCWFCPDVFTSYPVCFFCIYDGILCWRPRWNSG